MDSTMLALHLMGALLAISALAKVGPFFPPTYLPTKLKQAAPLKNKSSFFFFPLARVLSEDLHFEYDALDFLLIQHCCCFARLEQIYQTPAEKAFLKRHLTQSLHSSHSATRN